jgi:alkyl hydroperoxide reductase subunit AhpC
MVELVQLERRHEDFARRNVQVVVASIEGLELAKQSQAELPHLVVLSDEQQGLTNVADLIHRGVDPKGGDADAPTTFIVDRHGVVRWVYRSGGVLSRLSPDDVLKALDANLPRS